MADETARLVVEWMTKKVGLIAKWMLQIVTSCHYYYCYYHYENVRLVVEKMMENQDFLVFEWMVENQS